MLSMRDSREDRNGQAMSASAPDWAAPFRSAKGAGVIRPADVGVHALLLHLESDPRVASYKPFDPSDLLSADRAAALGRLAFFAVAHDLGSFVVTPSSARDRRGRVAQAAFRRLEGQLALTSRWLHAADPAKLCSGARWLNARVLAAARFAPVDPADRERLTDAVDGADGLPLGSALAHVKRSSDPLRALFAMICDGSLDVDLDVPLGKDTRLTSRFPSARRKAG